MQHLEATRVASECCTVRGCPAPCGVQPGGRREARPRAEFSEGTEAALVASECCEVRGGPALWVCRREARSRVETSEVAEEALIALFRCSTRQLLRSLRPSCWVFRVELFFDE